MSTYEHQFRFPENEEMLLSIEEETPADIKWDEVFAKHSERYEKRRNRHLNQQLRKELEADRLRIDKMRRFRNRVAMCHPYPHRPMQEVDEFGFSILRFYQSDWRYGVAIIPMNYIYARKLKVINVFESHESKSPLFQYQVNATYNLVRIETHKSKQAYSTAFAPGMSSINDYVLEGAILFRLNPDRPECRVVNSNLICLLLHLSLGIPTDHFYQEKPAMTNARFVAMKELNLVSVINYEYKTDRIYDNEIILIQGKDRKTIADGYVIVTGSNYLEEHGRFIRVIERYYSYFGIRPPEEIRDIINCFGVTSYVHSKMF